MPLLERGSGAQFAIVSTVQRFFSIESDHVSFSSLCGHMTIMPIDVSTLVTIAKHALAAWVWAKRKVDGKVAHAIPRIERHINKKDVRIKLYRITSQIPKVDVTDDLPLDKTTNDLASTIRGGLTLNEKHALAMEWNGHSEVRAIEAERCDYAEILAMREIAKKNNGPLPRVLSSNALIVCAQKRSLILHRRSAKSATKKGLLHIFGGAYKPSQPLKPFDIPGDRKDLEFTMIREVFEESGIIVRRYGYGEPVCVAEEVDTGFIQYVYLGVRITTSQYEVIDQNREGGIEFVKFDDLPQKLQQKEEWVESGLAHVLLWLGLGAPGAGLFPKFDGLSPRELFNRVVDI